jgi:hypothetical protein
MTLNNSLKFYISRVETLQKDYNYNVHTFNEP